MRSRHDNGLERDTRANTPTSPSHSYHKGKWIIDFIPPVCPGHALPIAVPHGARAEPEQGIALLALGNIEPCGVQYQLGNE
jgi:hypothetical protein